MNPEVDAALEAVDVCSACLEEEITSPKDPLPSWAGLPLLSRAIVSSLSSIRHPSSAMSDCREVIVLDKSPEPEADSSDLRPSNWPLMSVKGTAFPVHHTSALRHESQGCVCSRPMHDKVCMQRLGCVHP